MPSRHTQTGSTPLWLLIWLVGMAAIAYWCVVRHLPAIQGQLQSNAQAAVTQADAPDVSVNVEGRTAILTGAVATTAQKDTLLGALGNTSGIRHVDNQLNVVEVAIASNEENAAITDTGDGSSEPPADQDAPEAAANNDASAPSENEESQVTTDNEPEPTETETSTIGNDSDALNEQDTEQPGTEQTGTEQTGTEQLIDDVDTKARALIERAKNNQLQSNQAGDQPGNQTNDPASFKLSVADGTLTLTGNMSRQDNLTEFVRSAMSTFNANYVINSIQVSDDVAPAPWLNSLTEFVGDMEPINNAGIDLFESQISLSGVASSEQSHDAVINKALSKLSDLSLVERISIADANNSDNANAEPANTNDAQAVTTTSDTEQTATSAPRSSAALQTEFNALASTTILFESGSDVLTTESLRTIESMAALFAEYPDTDIEIDGHTDSSGIASNNLNLSQQRANAVRDYLIKLGISANRLSAYGFGDGVPIADNSTSAGRKLNRRIEFNF